MTRRTIYHFALTLALLALAVAYNSWNKDTRLLQQFSRATSEYLEMQETAAAEWRAAHFDGEAFRQPPTAQRAEENEAGETFTVLVRQRDSMVFWSNNRALPDTSEFRHLDTLPEKGLAKLATGYYCATRQTIGTQIVTTLIPLKYTLSPDPSRQRSFPEELALPEQVSISEKTTPYAVTLGSATICWLEAEGKIRYARLQWMGLVVYLLLVGLFFSLINKVSMWAAARYHPALGSTVLLCSVATVLWLNYALRVTAQFDALGIFAQKFNSPTLGSSLGEWLLYIVVLLWLMVFFHREFRVEAWRWKRLSGPLSVTFGVLYNLAMMMSIIVGVLLFRQLMFASSINFDFDNILNLDRYALLAIFGVVLLLAGLFLFSHRMMQTIFRSQLTRNQRAIALGIAASVMFFVCQKLYDPTDLSPDHDQIGVSPYYVVAFALTYVVAFDFFIENKSPGFGWIMIWLSIFSLFTALLLYRYNEQKDIARLKTCAIELAKDRDAVAEPMLRDFAKDCAADTVFQNLIGAVRGFDPPRNAFQTHVTKRVFEKNYLFQHYHTEVFLFDHEKQNLHTKKESPEPPSYDSIAGRTWEKAIAPLPDVPDLRWLSGADGNFKYIVRCQTHRPGDLASPIEAYIFFVHEYPQPTKVYSELFYSQPFKQLPLSPSYDFCIFKNGKIVAIRGNISDSLRDPSKFPAPGTCEEIATSERAAAVCTMPNGFTAVVERQLGGSLKRIYLFSSLFTLLSLFMIGLGSVNNRFRILPDYYQFYITTKGSLSKRIQYFTVALIVGSFIAIGVMTYFHFTRASERNELARLDYRTSSMLTHLSAKTLGMQPSAATLRGTLSPLISDLAKSFSVDVHLYDLNGDLLSTTQEELRRVGLLSQKMSTGAWQQLSAKSISESFQTENAGNYQFQTKYVALRNSESQSLGFIGIPYYLSERSVSADLSDFIGILASFYVCLLVIAGVATFFVARTIIQPLQYVAHKITSLQLETKNPPLEYGGDGQDELSGLIEKINEMMDKIEDSKTKLFKFERESAWKEMARQVAHDIKNPLTAMKLSMQQLERVASSGNFDRARDYLKLTIARLIGQIDSLATIASEFSLFAKLDTVNKFDMVINDLVENVFDLFSEMDGLDFEKNIAHERLVVSGDSSHLMRVFNNLIINATQAIPSDRRGKISVTVHRDGENAIVRVSDNGSGIPPEVAARIFEPNFTTKTSGSGLGLAICKKIIEVHDGEIWYESHENIGTDFYVQLPLSRHGQ